MATKAAVTEHEDLARELSEVVSGEVRFDPYTCALYSTDASIYQMMPVGVVLPQSLEDVTNTVRLAASAGVPVLPRGGGTALAGQSVNHAVVIDFSKYMNRLLEMNPEEGWAWVEPGIVLDRLSALGAPHGLKFAPDPATSSRGNVGGAIGNNSCGSHSIVYRKTVDHVLELETVLSDGTVATFGELTAEGLEAKVGLQTLEGRVYREALRIAEDQRDELDRHYPNILRRVSGYNLDEMLKRPINLAKLIIGSEGTLATVTRARVRMVRRPAATALAVLHFRTLVEAMEATVALLEEGPAAVELMDSNIVRQGRSQVAIARRMGFVEGDPEALLIVEMAGDTPEEAAAGVERVARVAQRQGLSYHTLLLTDPAEQANVWAVRRDGLGLIMSARGNLKALPFVEDTAVSPERLPEYIRRFDALVAEEGTTAAHYGHASVGCLHIRPLVDLKTEEGVGRMARIAERVADLVLEFGGSLSGEHGDGIVRGVFVEKMFGPKLHGAFRELKRAFDPDGIMNPGKILDCPPMTENLRISPTYRTWSVDTALDFSADGGFEGHVEMCNGQGACRKHGGTMCPSYMATKEEEHSTRGRANALRSILSGLLPPDEFTSHRLHDVLDLCLECKGCSAECPSSVDMAKLKYEFLAHYHREHGFSLRAKLFANVARVNQWGAALAPFSNWATKLPGARALQGLLGIHPNRPMPRFTQRTFSSWFPTHTPEPGAGTRGRVVLFHDTFMEGNDPEVGIAATRVLERLGYGVMLVPKRCCGRPMLSQGMLEQAREHARRNVDILYPLAREGVPIVGCEPSCLLTLRDEYLSLLPGNERAKVVADRTMLFDELVASVAKEEDLSAVFAPHDGHVLFHPHCHQKALTGTAASEAALRLVPEARVEVVDAGCCGMAGAFGYETEHYDVSMTIGELALLPAVRANPDATVVTTGVSCRQQVEHGTGVRPLHLAEFLAGQLR